MFLSLLQVFTTNKPKNSHFFNMWGERGRRGRRRRGRRGTSNCQ